MFDYGKGQDDYHYSISGAVILVLYRSAFTFYKYKCQQIDTKQARDHGKLITG